MAYSSFENLEVWKRGCRIAVRIYEVLKDCRDYVLKDQMTRAAVSISSNVAEGAERELCITCQKMSLREAFTKPGKITPIC